MGTQLTTPDFFRALLIPDDRVSPETLWEAQSTYAQQDPQLPGNATAQQDTDLAFETSGTISDSTTLEFICGRAGYPGRDGAGLLWRYDGDDRWRGRELPTSLFGWEALQYLDGSGTITTTSDPHVATLGNGTVICAYQRTDTSVGTSYELVTQARAIGGTWRSVVEVRTSLSAPTFGYLGCLVVMGDAEALLLSLVEVNADQAQVRVHRTTDSGATWTVRAQYALTTEIDISGSPGSPANGSDPQRMRAAYDPKTGQIALFIWTRLHDTGIATSRDILLQYASDNLGSTFTLINEEDGASTGHAYPDVVALASGGFLLAAGVQGGSSEAYTFGDAYETALEATGVALFDSQGALPFASLTFTDGDLTCTVGDDGVVWFFQRAAGATDQECYVNASYDEGKTVTEISVSETLGGTYLTWWDGEDGNTHPRDFAACFQRGRVLLVHQWDANPGNEDNSIAIAYLGGWSTLTMPQNARGYDERFGVGWTETWLPFDKPGDMTNWTAAGAGVGTLGSGRLRLNTSSAARYFSNDATSSIDPDSGILVGFVMKVDSGGDLATDEVAVNLRLDDGSTTSVEITIRIAAGASKTDFRVYDEEAAAQVGADFSIGTTDYCQVFVGLDNDRVSIWYRAYDTSEDMDLTAWASNRASLTDGGGSSALRRIRFGHISSTTSDSSWQQMHFTVQDLLGVGWAGGQTSPDGTRPGPVSILPIYYADGVSLLAKGGPASESDEWQVATRYTHGLEKLYTNGTYPSPRDTLRSPTGSPPAALTLSWQAPSGANELWRPSIAVWLKGNFKDGSVQLYNGSWSSAATINMADGFESIAFTRAGATLQVNSGGASTTGYCWVYENDLVGATVDLGSGKLRRIVRNTGGVFTNQSTTKTPIIYLDPDGVDGTEPNSGTMDIWMPEAVCYVALASLGQLHQGIRIVIDSQNTVDGDLRVKALVGQLYLFGDQPIYGTTLEYITDIDTTTLGDGRDQTVKRAPMGAVLELSWADPLGTWNLEGVGEPSPDYYLNTSAGSGDIAAVPGTAPGDIPGLMAQLEGPKTPCVYIHEIPADGTSGMVNCRAKFIYGRAYTSNSFRVADVAGDETRGGIRRPETVVIKRLV